MAHNFRLTGNLYISKDGDNANSGLTADLPKKDITVNGFSSLTIMTVGGGQYNPSDLSLASSPTIRYLRFDGTTKLNLTANWSLHNLITGGAWVFNQTGQYYVYIDFNGFNLFLGGSAGIGVTIFNNTVITNIVGINRGFSLPFIDFNKCVFDNNLVSCDFSLNADVRPRCYDCTIVNSNWINLTSVAIFSNSYISENSTIALTSYFSTPSTQFTNNNVQGKLNVAGTLYELKKDKSGTLIPSRIANGINDLSLIDATVYDRGNFSQDPEFVNLSKGDYWSIAPTSPHYVGVSNKYIPNIGNAKVQNTIAKTDNTTYFDVTDGTDIILSGGDLIFDTASINKQGVIPSKPIDLGKVTVLENITATMLLAFDSDDAIGTATNTNVLQVIQEHTTGTAEANPARLTYKMRWTKNSAMPVLASDWDNQGYVTAGEFGVFEINAGAKVSSLGGNIYTSGNPLFTFTNSAFVVARWVQFELYINEGINIV